MKRRLAWATAGIFALGAMGAGGAGTAAAAPSAPANGHFCAQMGVRSTDVDQSVHEAVCFSNYSKYIAYLSGGRVVLGLATRPTVPSAAMLKEINAQPASTTATYTLMILYQNASYGGTQYALNSGGHCYSGGSVVWNSMPAFDNQTTSARMGDNCAHGTLFWDVNQGQPSYAFTSGISNVGSTFNDQTSSAKANL